MLVTGSSPDLRASEYRPYCVLQRALDTRRKSYLRKTKGVVLSCPSDWNAEQSGVTEGMLGLEPREPR